MNSARRMSFQLGFFFWSFAEASIMPAAEKEISKIKVVIIVTNAKLLFPSSFRAEHNQLAQCRAERQITLTTFKISREIVPLSWRQQYWASDETLENSSKMATTGMQMDRLFLAMSFYRRRKFEECAEVCTQLLQKNPYDQVVHFLRNQKKVPLIATPKLFKTKLHTIECCWFFPVLRSVLLWMFSRLYHQASWCLKTRALTEQVYVDEVDVDEEGIAEMLMDDNAVAQLPR